MIRGWSTCPGNKGLRTGACSGWRRGCSEGTQELLPLLSRDIATPFTMVHGGTVTVNGQKLIQEQFTLDIRKNFVPHQVSETLELLPPSTVSSLGGFQDLTGSRPEQPVQVPQLTLLWGWGWTRGFSSSLANSVALWSYKNSYLPSRCFSRDFSKLHRAFKRAL